MLHFIIWLMEVLVGIVGGILYLPIHVFCMLKDCFFLIIRNIVCEIEYINYRRMYGNSIDAVLIAEMLVGIVCAILVLIAIWMLVRGTYIVIRSIIRLFTTRKVTKKVKAEVIEKDKETTGGYFMPSGKTMVYVPKSTLYGVYVEYDKYIDFVESEYLYDTAEKGQKIDLELIRRVSKFNGKDVTFKFKY